MFKFWLFISEYCSIFAKYLNLLELIMAQIVSLNEKFLSHSSGHWEVWDQGVRVVRFWWRPSSWFTNGCLLAVSSCGCMNEREGAHSLMSFFVYIFIFLYFLITFLIEGQLLYNIVLVSVIHQHESAIIIHMSPSSWISLPLPTPSHPSR